MKFSQIIFSHVALLSLVPVPGSDMGYVLAYSYSGNKLFKEMEGDG